MDRALEGPISSEPVPISIRDVEVVSSPLREVTASRKRFDLFSLPDGPDGEPVSLTDLEAVFSPGFNPTPRLATIPPAGQEQGAAAGEKSKTPTPPPGAVRHLVFEEDPDGEAPPLPLIGKTGKAQPAPKKAAPPATVKAPPQATVKAAPKEEEPPSSMPISSGSILAEGPPSSSPAAPVSSSAILESIEDEPGVDVDFDAPGEAAAKPKAPPVKKAPAHLPFFDVGDLDPRVSDIFAASPAPFDPRVPPLPNSAPPPSDPSVNSGLRDLRALVAKEEEALPAPEQRTSFSLFNLSGGLFEEPKGGLGAPDLHHLAQPAPRSGRPSAPGRPSSPTLPSPSQRPIAPVLLPAPAATASRPPPKAARSERRRIPLPLLGVVVFAACAGLGSLAFRWAAGTGTSPTATPIGPERAIPTAPVEAPPQTAAAVDPPQTGAVVVAPPPVEAQGAPAATNPGASAPKVSPSSAPTAAPVRETPAREPAAEKAPPAAKTAVEKTAPPVEAPPPPPSGADFDKAAAKAALAAAASRALSCKTADDPGGGARVSVTFAPSGRVPRSMVVSAPYQGTAIGGCIAAAFRSASVPPFDGEPVTVTKDLTLR
ncbi:MAG: hypothetical protein U0359_29335 [Byssovorax sp.]